jgi:Dolichyl-phosphate-mannose-protein mannosyltransferase
MQLPSSFWVDEMATVFVVEHGAGDPSLKVAPQVPQSFYYSVVRAFVSGRSEIEYRLPSILFLVLALWFVALLASRLIHPDAGWFAIFACFALKGINYEAANARPYAMGMCVAAAGLYFLVRWLDAGSVPTGESAPDLPRWGRRFRLPIAAWWDAILFVILAALLWRVHLIFWPFYVVFAIYALLRSRDRPRWQIAVVFATVGILLVPVAMRALELNSTANLHVVAAQPTWSTVERSLRLMLVVAATLGAWIWSRFATDRPRIAIPASTFALILAWWLWHPLALFAFSRITGNSVFVPRYTGFSLPGTAMAATLAAALFLPPRSWKPAALLLGACALVLFGQWTEVWPAHHNSDWRGAAVAVNNLALPPSIPVICPSPFIEARPPAWAPDYQMPGFLYAHLLVYPLQGGNVVLFPFAASPEADDYATALLQGAVPSAGRFVIYGSSAQAHFWRDWFEKRPELDGWSHRSLGPFLDVDAILFERH